MENMDTKSNRSELAFFLCAAPFLCFPVFGQVRTDSAPHQANRGVILSATNTILGVSGKNVQLFVSLTEDGKVEWDQFVNNSVKRRSTVISVEQLSAIKRDLGVIKTGPFRAVMGPYNTYTDTSVELRIRMMGANGRFTFTVVNPWKCDLPSCSQAKTRTMPAEVQAVLCEVGKLRSTVAEELNYQICE